MRWELLHEAILAIEDHLVVREPNLWLAAVFHVALTNSCEKTVQQHRNLFQALAAALAATMDGSRVC